MLTHLVTLTVFVVSTALASPTAFQQPTVCASGQMAVGHQTDQDSGTYGVIFDSTCTQMDFKSAQDSSMCGSFAYGSKVSCKGSTVSTADVSIEGDQLTMFGACSPAPTGSNCNNAFGLTLNTTLAWCCS